MALISKDQFSQWIAMRRRSTLEDGLDMHAEGEPEDALQHHQLMAASSLSSIIGPAFSMGARPYRQPVARLTGHVDAIIDATITKLSLNRDTGSVSGVLTTEGGPVVYLPQFLRTAKGQAAIKSDGSITYTPWPGARRAASRAGAGFRGADADTLSLAAARTDGASIRVHVRVMILAH